MRQREVVFGVEALLDQRIDVIDVQLTLVEHKVDGAVADEASVRLPGQKLAFQLRPLL
jgi:hypothetical protein